MYSHPIYERIKRWLAPLERRGADRAHRAGTEDDTDADTDVIVYGLGRFGGHLVDRLTRAGHRVLAVDYDPQKTRDDTRDGVTTMYGGAEDVHLLETLPLARARCVISAIPDLETNLALLHNLRHHDYRGRTAVTAFNSVDAERLRAAGPAAVLEPFATAATVTVDAIDELLDTGHGDRETP